MPYHDLVRAVTAAAAFMVTFAGHLIGDHWVQTSAQACKKALDGPHRRAVAVWHCAKHVATWTATVAVFLAAAGWWLNLPLKPGWVAAGMAVNAITHFVADLRTPIRWMGELSGKAGYISHVQVMRPAGPEATGPGTALFWLDQSWHIAWLAVSALLIAGP